MSLSPAIDGAQSPIQFVCRWDWCRQEFTDQLSLRQHVMRSHVEQSVTVPKDSLHVWQSGNGVWRGREKEYTPAARRRTIAPITNAAHVNNITHQMQVDSEALQTPEISGSVPKPASHHLDAYGIPRSQEAAVVTQVFSPYITSSDEQQQAQAAGPEFHTHARNPSNESASLPQSHDYETVQGILPQQVQQASSPAYQPPSGSTTTSDGGRTTPLRIGIAFGTLPNISSSEGSTSTSSTNLFAARTDKTDGKAVGGGNSPNGNKKSSDKSLRFGFGNR